MKNHMFKENSLFSKNALVQFTTSQSEIEQTTNSKFVKSIREAFFIIYLCIYFVFIFIKQRYAFYEWNQIYQVSN